MDNRKITIRRLFRADIPLAEKAFSAFDFLHYNPVCSRNLLPAMTYGQMWGAFDGENMVGCTWLVAADSPFFRDSTAAWEIADLMEMPAEDIMIAGYVWQAENYEEYNIYAAFCHLWQMQSAKNGKRMVVHYSPRHINTDMGRLFRCGWQLCGLRGLDKLVPHFLFVKRTDFSDKEAEIPRNVKLCPVSDTKKLSMLCEHGYRGVGLDADNNLLFVKGSDCID